MGFVDAVVCPLIPRFNSKIGDSMQIGEALDAYALQLHADGRSKHTVGQVRRHVSVLARWADRVGHTGEIEALGHTDLAQFLVSPEARTRPDGKPKKATSTNALRSSLKTFLGYLHAAGMIPTNPGRLIRRAHTGEPPPKAMTERDQSKLLQILAGAKTPGGRRDRVLFELMLRTGIRLGSALALRGDDVDLEAQEIRLRHTKGDREQIVYLNRSIADLLAGFIESRSGSLFVGPTGAQITPRHIQRRLHEWLDRAGIARAYSPHSLRHSFAVRLLQKTGNIRLVQQALGHRSIASTSVYVTPSGDSVRKAVALA